jgi:hypothetical protein
MLTTASPSGSIRHPSVPFWLWIYFPTPTASAIPPEATAREPPEHTAKQPFRLMALRQQQPVIAAYFTSRPPFFTGRCCKLVSDPFSVCARGSGSEGIDDLPACIHRLKNAGSVRARRDLPWRNGAQGMVLRSPLLGYHTN